MHNRYIQFLLILFLFLNLFRFFWNLSFLIFHRNFYISVWFKLVSVSVHESDIISKESCDIIRFVFCFFLKFFLCLIILIIHCFYFFFFFITHRIGDFFFDDWCNRKGCAIWDISCIDCINCYLYVIIFICKLKNRLSLFCCRFFIFGRSFCLLFFWSFSSWIFNRWSSFFVFRRSFYSLFLISFCFRYRLLLVSRVIHGCSHRFICHRCLCL